MFVATVKVDTEVQSPQRSTTSFAVEALQQGGLEDHTAAPTKQTTPGSQSILRHVEDTLSFQCSTEPTESDGFQKDQPVLQAEERPIAAPMLGDIKMKIKIPYDYKNNFLLVPISLNVLVFPFCRNVSLQWWERVVAYFRYIRSIMASIS